MTKELGPCEEWTGSRNAAGYGVVTRRKFLAHRVAYEQAYGPIPAGKVVRHRCDNPPCVRLSHLLLGTQANNVQDAADRNRMPFGEAHHNVKLSKSLVRAIRQEYADGPLTQRLLAEKYSVTQPTISKIITGKRRTKEFKINA